MPSKTAGYFIGAHVLHYVDDLLRDMGLTTIRSRHFVAENLLPNWPSRYRTVGEERRRARSGEPLRRPFYLSGARAAGLLLLALLSWRLLV